ncbi:uncharacterized protein A1O9_12158 [Exophiala aquamarina CBS 119918]|uniref:BHLH domain-containing protein n=1 Tax=Exophiala aquamarina CBS 119918 TaxID=1182545 RepID=A0A072NW67_9EURO|nr:uncharacterized protein A1O9_12158 [Exophiala aquamarina CBS 119918]KEF51821.1 hypothetical protein A1O9_12158 [Exophiala aquamarina CBS 119918]
MLATQRMSSHGGQQSFPFGYQPENIHGLGLPEFMTPGPPPGQPLLNADENQNLDNFFHDFDSNAITANKQDHHVQYGFSQGHPQYYNMPPMFVGSDTGLAHRAGIEPHQAGGFPYADAMMAQDMALMGHPSNLNGAIHPAQYNDGSFNGPLLAQLQTAAAMQPTYDQGWQQPFTQPGVMNVLHQGRTGVHYGTDFRFQPTGYAAPNVPTDPDMIHPMHPMDILEPTSGSSTQPNTQPNTQPSSPVWTKKRTFEDFQQEEAPRNGFAPLLKTQLTGPTQPSVSIPSSRKQRKSVVKTEPHRPSQPPTPLSNSKPRTLVDSETRAGVQSVDHEDDAEAEEDDDATNEQAKSPSPAPWPSSKARPPRVHVPPPPKKPPRKKKASMSSSTPVKSKLKAQRTASAAQSSQSTRVPLSLEQKKANHTNSEQRRRDATARSYAELYDLVPELEDQGKQSTMKKLELVVAKVRTVMQRVEELRAKLGIDPATGRQLGPPGASSLAHSGLEAWQR